MDNLILWFIPVFIVSLVVEMLWDRHRRHELYEKKDTLACLAMAVPAFHYMVAVAGGNSIRCAPYATFGTQTLSDNALKALEGRRACLLANHGMIATGASLKSALALAVEIEALCEQYWRALQIGKPNLLADAEMAVVVEKFKTYNAQAR